MIPVSKIKYLAFEGGGGKGVAYLGAIEALEEKGVLPISNDNRQIWGVSGSSTGAINALMLSLHMSTDEIENELKNKNFEEFYTKDTPNRSIFRAVFTEREKSDNPLKPGKYINKDMIKVGFAVDKIESKPINPKVTSVKFENLERFIFPAHTLLTDKTKADAEAKKIIDNNNNFFTRDIDIPLVRQNLPSIKFNSIKQLLDLIFKKGDLAKKSMLSDDGMKRRIFNSTELFAEYFYNIVYDRGLFPGFNPREYFSSLITRIMKEKFSKDIDGSTLSFEKFYEITEVDIRISGANISNQIPVYFSKKDTPDFPVAEAVGMAMSMPMIFKPVYVDAVVHKLKDDEYQKKYRGFYVDAGTIRNFPLHAFDDEGINPKELNPEVIGFQLTSGAEIISEFDNSMKLKIADEDLAKLYKQFEDEYKEKYKRDLDYSKIYPFQFGNINKFKVDNIIGTTALEFASKLFESIMYYTEEGQIRNEMEKEQVINLYTYHVFTRDFNPLEPLREFVRKKAFNKTKELLKIN